ncbi:MAG: ABC transporter permease subunit, partial [Phycisphaerae bacterium]|nr:ABC transporter permease subunit [Phycisphaerae bacterium]
MTKIWAICRTTFLQTIRQPIYGVLILVTFALMVGNLPLSGWTVGSDYHTTDQKMLENVGLSTLLVTGLLIAAFSAAGAIGREIEDKTTLTVISKPVGRAAFVLGKFVGLAAAVILAYYLCSLVFLLTVRHKVTPSAADQLDWPVIVLGASAFVLAILVAAVGNLVFAWTFTAAVVWSAAILLSAAVGI